MPTLPNHNHRTIPYGTKSCHVMSCHSMSEILDSAYDIWYNAYTFQIRTHTSVDVYSYIILYRTYTGLWIWWMIIHDGIWRDYQAGCRSTSCKCCLFVKQPPDQKDQVYNATTAMDEASTEPFWHARSMYTYIDTCMRAYIHTFIHPFIHYTTLRDATLICIALHCTTLPTLHYITLH